MKIHSIQYLRGVAALLVVVFHLQPQLERMGLSRLPIAWMSGGVDLFFVISGFIMWWTTRPEGMVPGVFVRRRLHRIVPLYWALTTLYLLVLLVAPQVVQTGKLDVPHLIASYLFIPWPHPAIEGAVMPTVATGWTLNYEMFFYAIFALALFAPRSLRLATITAVMVGLTTLGFLLQPEGTIAAHYTSTLLLEFLFGVWIGAAISGGWLLTPRVSVVLFVVAALSMPLLQNYPVPQTRFLFWGIPSAGLIYAAVSWELQRPIPRWSIPLLLGNASYSIYLSHQLSLSAAGQGWRRLVDAPLWISAPGFAVVGFAFAVTVGLACYIFVEQPLSRLTAPLFRERRPAPAHAGTAAQSRPSAI